MDSKSKADYLAYQDDEYVNRLATDWFFLNMFFNSADLCHAQQVVDLLIEAGLLLRRCLREAGHTCLSPRNICVDEDLYFNIWLDADGDIKAGDLYMDERKGLEL